MDQMSDYQEPSENIDLKQYAINHVVDGIYWMDEHSRIQEVNDGACRMVGYSREELTSMTVGQLNPDISSERWRAQWDLLQRQGSTTLDSFHRHKDGHLINVEITANLIVYDGRQMVCSFVRDITERKRNQRLMEMMKFSMDHMADKVTWVTPDARVVYANIAACASLGYTMEEMLKMGVPDFDPDFPADDWPKHWEELKKHGSFTFETRHRTKSGVIYPVEVSINYMRFGDEEYNCGFARDITKRKQVEEELQLSSMVLQTSSEGMLVTDENNQIISVNPAFSKITGYSFEEVKGKDPRMFRSDRHDQAFYQAMWHAIVTTGQWQGEIWDKRKNGEVYAKWLTINTLRNKDGAIHRYMALFSDITEKKKSEELIWRQANFDTLTGLPNRDMFRDRLGQEVKKTVRANLPLALLLVDLDQFKEVNDTLGHAMGDMLLKEAARRIGACVRESDTVARLGGDEFTIILSEISGNSHVEAVAQKVIEKLAEPFQLGREIAYVSASIGITLYPNDATDIEVLMKNADQAMYVAKNRGRNRFSYFTPALQDMAQRRLRLTNDLRGALEAGEFSLHFQPIVMLSTGRIHKVEALLRWHHAQQGLISPAEFIPLAEATGLIHEIGDWVFKEAARLAKHWRNQFTPDLQVSINKSPVQFKSENYHNASKWSEYLQELGLPGESIVVEITEGLLLNAEADVTDELLRLGDAGIQVAIDDFGTGYSSLSYLKKFDIDYLKIDRSFVSNLETDANDMALSEAIIVMAHKLGLKVIAEGVETEAQRSLLIAAGCDYAQGNLFAKPVPPEEFAKLLVAQGR
jgi:diguanylate cyclase (GGDEF)-like protein/PAS domain S-box-containing protein